MTDHDMGVSSKLSEVTVGLSDGSCRTVGGIPVGAVITVGPMSDLCRKCLSDCRTRAQHLLHSCVLLSTPAAAS